ncbi:hypothetical protein HDU91_004032, partial [Kappamyces sp. JEL0680]
MTALDHIEDYDVDHSPVEPREMVGWYSIGVAGEGIFGLGTAVFYPFVMQGLAALEAYAHYDPTHSTKCDTSTAYTCDVNVGG